MEEKTGINFDRYDNIPVETSGRDAPPPAADFAGLNLPEVLNQNIQLAGYAKPTPIQKYTVPISMAGRDLMACAQTGSGKTASFLLPMITKLLGIEKPPPARKAYPLALILSPTRELTSQICNEAKKFCYLSGCRPVVVYGGADIRDQLRDLERGCELLVATPGRLVDLMERARVSLQYCCGLILDEADRMLDMGFEPQIRRIVRVMPPPAQRHTLLFSATFPETIQKLAKEFLRPYVWIAVGRVGSTVEGITQRIWQAAADKRQKLGLVVKALAERDGRTLVFVEKKRSATWLKKMLRNGGASDAPPAERFTPVAAEDIHGDRSQSQREAALAAFRSGSCRVLVATDVAARGLDVPGVEHVINMDLPFARDDFDSYVHRIGRTGRGEEKGYA